MNDDTGKKVFLELDCTKLQRQIHELMNAGQSAVGMTVELRVAAHPEDETEVSLEPSLVGRL